ncbi:MAG: hydantoinase/oxoprolinase N-terminal domain-containing protein [Verrucomicrobiota bacterium]
MSGAWQISADTGGTFTDLIGTNPEGHELRSKVLSSGCLRAQVESVEGNHVTLNSLPVLAPGLLRGFKLRLAGDASPGTAVILHEGATLTLEEVDYRYEVGQLVELITGEEAPIFGARIMTGTPGDAPLPPIDLRLGTTRGTNALLEKRGAKTLFLVTEGFADLLEIGDQRRPDLFALNILKPRPLYDYVVEVPERLSADGSVVKPLEWDDVLKSSIQEALSAGCEAAAVALVHRV